MSGAEITISAVERKGDGVSNPGRPWTLWAIHSTEGSEYRTFDSVLAHRAFEAVGQRAEIEWEFGAYGRDLKSLTVCERSQA